MGTEKGVLPSVWGDGTTVLKPYEPSISIERVFNLGDYKSFRVKVFPSELSDEAKEAIMLDNIFDAQKQFLLNQLIEAKMYRKDVAKWEETLERLEALKAEYFTKEA